MGFEQEWGPEGIQELRALYEPLRRFAGAVGNWGIEPDDLVQDAYARILRRRRDTIRELGPYLRKTIVHLATDGHRRGVRSDRAHLRLAEPDVVVDIYPSDLDDLLRLPARTRALLYLVEIEGRTAADAAEIIGMTAANARVVLMRARRRLRSELEAEATGE